MVMVLRFGLFMPSIMALAFLFSNFVLFFVYIKHLHHSKLRMVLKSYPQNIRGTKRGCW